MGRSMLPASGGRVLARLRAHAAGLSTLAVGASLAGAVVVADGYHTRKVELDDSGVWVTRSVGPDGDLGRANLQVGVVDTKLTVTPQDVWQVGSEVLVRTAAGELTEIDARLGTRVPNPLLIGAAEASMGGGTIAVLDPVKGLLHLYSPHGLDSGPLAAAKGGTGTTKVPGDATVVVGVDGITHLVSGSGLLEAISPTGSVLSKTQLPKSLGKVQISAVGRRAVVLAADTGDVYVEGHSSKVGALTGGVLQQPSPARSTVLIANSSLVVAVPLDGGLIQTVDTSGAGAPAAPVWLASDDCTYLAWGGQKSSYSVHCVGRSPVRSAGVLNPVWRVNRNHAVLNDRTNGNNIAFAGDVATGINDWTQAATAQQEIKKTQDSQIVVVSGDVQPNNKKGPNHKPHAVDDNVATRPGRPVVVPVLRNDADPDGDPLTVTLDALPSNLTNAVAVVDGGQQIQVTPLPGQVAPISFSYTVNDGRGLSDTARVTVAIHPDTVNAAPTGPAETYTVEAGKRIIFNALRNVTDPDGDPVTVVGVSLAPANGTAQFTGGGIIVAEAGATPGTFPMSVAIEDDHGGTGTLALSLKVTKAGENIAPETHDDHLQLVVGAEGFVDVLANDTDANDDLLTLAPVAPQPNLSVTPAGGGTLRVQATKAGTYSVKYTVQDGTSQSSGYLRVDVTDGNARGAAVVAVRDDVVAYAGSSTTADVLANDQSTTGAVLVVQSVDTSAVAKDLTVEVVDHDQLRITPIVPLTGPVAFTYVVTDGSAFSTGTVVVRPAPVGLPDQAPVTREDTANVRVGNGIPIDVLANDFDPEAGPLTLKKVDPAPPGDGTVFVEGDHLGYLAPSKPRGSVNLTYYVADRAGNVSAGHVLLRVLPPPGDNRAPIPLPVVARAFSGETITVHLPLLGSDPDGDVVTLDGVTPPPLADKVVGTVGALGTDSFPFVAGRLPGNQLLQYRVRDAYGLTSSGTVRIGVVDRSNLNHPPNAVDDKATVKPGGEVHVPVLVNDTDPDADPLEVIGVSKVAGATSGFDAQHVILKVPASAHLGQIYSLGYDIDDHRGGTSRASVEITVSNTPLPVVVTPLDDLAAAQKEGEPVSLDVLSNDVLPPGISPSDLAVTFSAGAPARWAGGRVQLTMPGHAVTFSYTLSVGTGPKASALVVVPFLSTLTSSNQLPRAVPDSATTESGKPVTVAVLANDTVAPGKHLTLDPQIVATIAGKAEVHGDKVVYTPSGGAGLGGFTYRISDGTNAAVGVATITITAPPSLNTPPHTTTLTLNIPAGASKAVDLAFAVSDAENDPLRFSGLTGAGNGVGATLSGSTLTVKTDNGARGKSASLSYAVSDGHPGHTAVGHVAVTVTGLNKPLPQAVADHADSQSGKAVTIQVLANDVNPLDTGPLKVIAASGSAQAGSVRFDNASVTFTPTRSFVGRTTLSYTIQDASGDPTRQSVGQITVDVIGRPSAPGAPTGTSDSRTVALTWSAPSNNGAPIDRYTVTWSGGKQQCPTSACSITGLTNGTTYTFVVLAHNSVGDGPGSPASGPFTPNKKPPMQAAPTVLSGDTNVMVSWTPDQGDGTPITGFTLVESPDGLTQKLGGSATSYTWPNLTNGSAYSFRLIATNSAGDSASSDNSAAVTPAGKPLTPSAPVGSATPNAGTVVVNWSAPGDNGAQITGYTVEAYQNGAPYKTIAHTDTSNLQETIASSTTQTYTFDIIATNKVGNSQASPKSPVVIPTARPDAISSVSATPGDQQATISFTDPNDNGKAITGYQVQVNGAARMIGVSTRVITGLTNGTTYSFAVSACNPDGCGTYSPASAGVVPYGVPGSASVSNSVNGNTITWSWNAPNDNGSAITGYDVYVDGGLYTSTGATSFGHDFGACGQGHSVYVRAKNGAGAGGASNTSGGTTAACPPPPYVTVAVGARPSGTFCTSSLCRYVVVTINNDPGGDHQIACVANGDAGIGQPASASGQFSPPSSYSSSANGGSTSQFYQYGWHGTVACNEDGGAYSAATRFN